MAQRQLPQPSLCITHHDRGSRDLDDRRSPNIVPNRDDSVVDDGQLSIRRIQNRPQHRVEWLRHFRRRRRPDAGWRDRCRSCDRRSFDRNWRRRRRGRPRRDLRHCDRRPRRRWRRGTNCRRRLVHRDRRRHHYRRLVHRGRRRHHHRRLVHCDRRRHHQRRLVHCDRRRALPALLTATGGTATGALFTATGGAAGRRPSPSRAPAGSLRPRRDPQPAPHSPWPAA